MSATLGNISRSAKEVDNFVNSDKQNSAKPSLDSYLVRPQQGLKNNVTNSFDKRVDEEKVPLPTLAKPLVTKNVNSTIKDKIDTRNFFW